MGLHSIENGLYKSHIWWVKNEFEHSLIQEIEVPDRTFSKPIVVMLWNNILLP
jgi:hypothetical protein